MKGLVKFFTILKKVEHCITTPSFIIMLVVMVMQVVWRYIIKQPLPWSEEMARYLFVVSTFLGVSIATAERGNIEINFMELAINKIAREQSAKMKAAKVINAIRDAVTIICTSLIGWQTYLLLVDQYFNKTISTAMGIPLWVMSGFMVLGFILIILNSLGLIIFNLGGYGPYGYEFAEEDMQCIL